MWFNWGISGFEVKFEVNDGFTGYEPITYMFGESQITQDYEVYDFPETEIYMFAASKETNAVYLD